MDNENGNGNDYDEEIDIAEYELDKDYEIYNDFFGILNVYTCYFKQLYNRPEKTTMFDGIDYEKQESTNRCMESLYAEINKYNKCDRSDKDDLYGQDNNINIDEIDELYGLYIDNDLKYLCICLLPILKHLVTLKWNEVNWSIIKIK